MSESFHVAHRLRFGHSEPCEEVELVTVRVRTIGPPCLPDPPRFVAEEAPAPRTVDARFAGGGVAETQVVHRGSLGEGSEIVGPTIVVGSDATLLVPPGVTGRCDAAGTIRMEVE